MRWLLRCAAISGVILSPAPAFTHDKFFDSNGVQIRYVEQGVGEPIVLMHGFTTSLQIWLDSGVFQNLAGDHRVIALDGRGRGKSGKPHDPKQYGREMALDIVRLLDHLRIRRAHIVGYSLGADTTAQLLTMHPDRFLTATLGGSAGRFRWGPQDDQRAERVASEMEQGSRRTLELYLAPPSEPMPTEEELTRRSEIFFANPLNDRYALAAIARSQRDQVITPAQVAAVTVPTLGIAGSDDPLRGSLEELKKLRPGLKLVVIEGAAHSGERGAIRRPEFVAAIREFTASHRETSSRSGSD